VRDPRLACGAGVNGILGHAVFESGQVEFRVEVGIRTGVAWTYSAIALNTCSRELPRKACLGLLPMYVGS
jgi:hypothetical protein